MSHLQATPSSLQSFHQRAVKGERLKVAFLGSSLTWGANASDPQRTSWRGLMMQYLADEYPKAPLTFIDVAIGGTGSSLALFRIDRDVLPQKPDLVFLDCTVNDDAEAADVQSLASYERLLRDIASSGSAVFPVLLYPRQHVEKPDDSVPPRHLAHAKLAGANALGTLRERVRTGSVDPKKLWAFERDGSHPDDAGYAALFDAIRDAYEKAARSEIEPCISKETVFPDPHRFRQILAAGAMPGDWSWDKTRHTSMCLDGLSSRWMDDVAVARLIDGEPPQPLEIPFHGSRVGIFGERDALTLPIRVWIDGKPLAYPKAKLEEDNRWELSATRFVSHTSGAGQLFNWTVLSKDFPYGGHTLRIEPDFTHGAPRAELRIESVCSAGR